MTDLEHNIAQRLHDLDPQIDLVALEQPATESLRLFIDHPDGVTLGLCEQVTHHLNDLRADYSLEVSSPGSKYRDRTRTASEPKESLQ
jgi:ribosome maturation factor RimP